MIWLLALLLALVMAAPAAAQQNPRGFVTTAAPVYTNNTFNYLSLDTGGSLRVTITGGAGSGGTSSTDKSAWVAGTTAGTPAMGAFDDVAPNTLAEDTVGVVRLTSFRAFHVNLRDNSGNEVSVGGGTQYDQGTATTATDKLMMSGAVRHDTATVDGGVADGDRLVLSTDSAGRLRVTSADTTQPVSGTVAISGTVAVTQSTSPWVANVTQFGSNNVVTGTGASGVGIPRVTISNDSSLAANQSVNVNQWGGTGTTLGQKAMTASVPVALASDQSAIPVSQSGAWSVTANAGTNLNTSALLLDATFTGRINTQGQKTMAASTPVVIASDQSAVAVSGTVTANQGGAPWSVVGTKTNNNAAPGATNVGTLPGVATNAAPSYTEGNQVALSTDLTGALRVAGGGGLSVTDSATWTAASSAFTPAGGEYNPTAAPLASGQQGTLALTGARAAQVNAVDSIGRELGASMSGKNTVPVVVALASTLPAQRPALGGPNALPVPGLSASVKNANQPVVQSDPATVVNLSPNPSLQCPFTAAVSQTGNTQIITGTAGKRAFFCSMRWVSATAQSVSLVSGTGSTCSTGTIAIVGSTTAANGESYAANGGVAEYSDRILTPPPAGMANGDNVCLLQSSSGIVAGKITYGLY